MRALRRTFGSFALIGGCAALACSSDEGAGGPDAFDAGGVLPESGTVGADGSGTDAATATDAPVADGSLLSPTFVYRDINHVLGTGQSLSVGAVGSPALSTMQPFDNRMFATGCRTHRCEHCLSCVCP